MKEEQREKKLNFNIKLSLEDAKKLLIYLDEEFMDIYEQFIESIEEEHGADEIREELDYYNEIRNVLENFTYELHKEVKRKEKSMIREYSDEDTECKNIIKKLNIYSGAILKKVVAIDKNEDYYPIYKIYWYLHNSFDKTGEVIFSENSLEDLLELDRGNLEKFLEYISNFEIVIGNKKGKIIEKYKFLNSSTIKLKYNLYIVKPHLAQFKDKNFKIGTIEKIEAKHIN